MLGSEFRAKLLRALVRATGASLTGTTLLSACGPTEENRCFFWPETSQVVAGCGDGDPFCDRRGGPMCPAEDEAKSYLFSCGEQGEVESKPARKGEECCYDVSVESTGERDCGADEGRPLRRAGKITVAKPEARDDWRVEMRPDLRQLSFAERHELGSAWMRAALSEHASVASFLELVDDLLANAAPGDLVRAARDAASDEIEHAILCFSLASAYLGVAVGPGPLPRAIVARRKSLLELARGNARDACRNETLAVIVLNERLERAKDPIVRRVLKCLVDDESRHAVLAFRIAAWAVQVGGAAARRVTTEELAAAPTKASAQLLDEGNDRLQARGFLTRPERERVARRGYFEVIRPALASLLSATPT
jgi:hypothetical protein